MDKRAQGLPITTIIVAILGLVVLVILFAVTTGRLAIFGRGVSECPGACVYDSNDVTTGKTTPPPTSSRTGTNCIDNIEKQLVGSYIPSGYPTGTKPAAIVQCKACCIPLT